MGHPNMNTQKKTRNTNELNSMRRNLEVASRNRRQSAHHGGLQRAVRRQSVAHTRLTRRETFSRSRPVGFGKLSPLAACVRARRELFGPAEKPRTARLMRPGLRVRLRAGVTRSDHGSALRIAASAADRFRAFSQRRRRTDHVAGIFRIARPSLCEKRSTLVAVTWLPSASVRPLASISIQRPPAFVNCSTK